MLKLCKKLIPLLLAAALCIGVLAGCAASYTRTGLEGGDPAGEGGEGGGTKLATPSNLRIEQTALLWDAVENATGYVVKADGRAPINILQGRSQRQPALHKRGIHDRKLIHSQPPFAPPACLCH